MCYVVVRRDPLFDLVPLVDVFNDTQTYRYYSEIYRDFVYIFLNGREILRISFLERTTERRFDNVYTVGYAVSSRSRRSSLFSARDTPPSLNLVVKVCKV